MLTHKLAAERGEIMFDLGESATPPSAKRLTFRPSLPAEPPIGIAVIGADDSIEFCNAPYLELWGVSRRGPGGGIRSAGESWSRVLDPEAFHLRMGAIRFRQDGQHTRKVVSLGDGRCIELVSAEVRDVAAGGLKRIMFVRDAGRRQEPGGGGHLAGLAGLVGVLALLVAALSMWPQASRANLLSGDGGVIAAVDTSQAR